MGLARLALMVVIQNEEDFVDVILPYSLSCLRQTRMFPYNMYYVRQWSAGRHFNGAETPFFL